MIDQGFVKRVAICDILIIFAEWSADGCYFVDTT